jgi:hypothetical protein
MIGHHLNSRLLCQAGIRTALFTTTKLVHSAHAHKRKGKDMNCKSSRLLSKIFTHLFFSPLKSPSAKKSSHHSRLPELVFSPCDRDFGYSDVQDWINYECWCWLLMKIFCAHFTTFLKMNFELISALNSRDSLLHSSHNTHGCLESRTHLLILNTHLDKSITKQAKYWWDLNLTKILLVFDILVASQVQQRISVNS